MIDRSLEKNATRPAWMLALVLATLALLGLLGTSPARATDGVVEVNQTCATLTGCMQGDGPGFPVTIVGAGSYRLTSNLVLPDTNTDGITYTGGDITIDLNGFAIMRASFTGRFNCAAQTGTGHGIRLASGLSGAFVENGRILGMGEAGLLLGPGSHVKQIDSSCNGGDGLTTLMLNTGSLRVEDSQFIRNDRAGILSFFRSVVTGSLVRENGHAGIRVGKGSVVKKNVVERSGSAGILSGGTSVISMNTVWQNGGDGISTNTGSIVSANAVSSSGSDGIFASNGSTVFENSIRDNDDFGIRVISNVGYRDNIFEGNGAGTVNGGLDLGGNVCDGTTTCP